MDDCCARSPAWAGSPCPGCGGPGREVDRITLKALLRPHALRRLGPGEHRFCPSPDCPIVYFPGQGETFGRDDVGVPVFQKEAGGARLVCHCLEISEDQLRREIEASGAAASVERIKCLVASERCACEVRNPQGTCCLGNVTAVVLALGPDPQGVAGVPRSR